MPEVRFLLFLLFISGIFFLPDGIFTIGCAVLGILFSFVAFVASPRHPRPLWPKITRQIVRTLPFVVFVFLCNGLLGDWQTAGWIAFRLLVVCAETIIYASTTPVQDIANLFAKFARPLRRFGLHPEDIYLLVSISLCLIPALQKILRETRQACQAKGLPWNLRTARVALIHISQLLLVQAAEIETALLAKDHPSV